MTAKTTARGQPLRIPLRRRAVEEPSSQQLVYWARREGLLQRLAPHHAYLPAERLPAQTLLRLRALYAGSVARWREREAAELAARLPSRPLQQLLAEALAALPLDRS